MPSQGSQTDSLRNTSKQVDVFKTDGGSVSFGRVCLMHRTQALLADAQKHVCRKLVYIHLTILGCLALISLATVLSRLQLRQHRVSQV